jgi:hypothetical protein
MDDPKRMRVLIVSDSNGKWYVRKVKRVILNKIALQKCYICDTPIGKRFASGEKALAAAQFALARDDAERVMKKREAASRAKARKAKIEKSRRKK